VQCRNHGERDAAVEPLVRRAAGQFAEQRLARQADRQRHVGPRELGQSAQQGEIVLESLAETESGVDEQLIRLQARREAGVHPLAEERLHLGEYVAALDAFEAAFRLPKVLFRSASASGDCCTPALRWGGLPIAGFLTRCQLAEAPDGLVIRYLSRADLIRMRRAAGRPFPAIGGKSYE